MFLKISQNSQENTCARDSFLIKLQPCACICLFILTWEKAMKAYINLLHQYPFRKHPNNDDNICILPSSTCFQQYFHDWSLVLYYNSYLKKSEWAPLLFIYNWISDLSNRGKLFFIPVAAYASFHIRLECLTIFTGKNLCFTEFSTTIHWNSSLAASDVFHMFTQSIKSF